VHKKGALNTFILGEKIGKFESRSEVREKKIDVLESKEPGVFIINDTIHLNKKGKGRKGT